MVTTVLAIVYIALALTVIPAVIDSAKKQEDKVVAAMGDEFDKRRYFPNGAFINADSLNRIEQACLDTYKAVKSQTTCLTRLDFRLGDVQLGNL